MSDLGGAVRGASAGNGIFGMRDFFGQHFSTPATLELPRELFGQPIGAGQAYGTADGNGGDLSPDPNGNAVTAPAGGYWFVAMATAGGENMQVSSTAPVVATVPEQASFAMLPLGPGLGGDRRRGAPQNLMCSLSAWDLVVIVRSSVIFENN